MGVVDYLLYLLFNLYTRPTCLYEFVVALLKDSPPAATRWLLQLDGLLQLEGLPQLDGLLQLEGLPQREGLLQLEGLDGYRICHN